MTSRLKPHYRKIQTWLNDGRAPERLIVHYELERELAAQLLQAAPGQRIQVAAEAYGRLFDELPDHPQKTRTGREAAPARPARYLKRHLGPDITFLEIGAGDGSLSRHLASHCKQVVAVDVTDALEPAKDAPANFRFLLSQGVTFDLPTASIDVAFSNQLMEHLHPDDAAAQLREVCRVLKGGGLYICRTPHRLLGPTDVSAYFDDVATGFHLKEYAFAEMAALMKQAGFSRVGFRLEAAGRVWVTAPPGPMILLERVLGALPRRWLEPLKRNIMFGILLGMSVIAWK